MKLRTMRDIPTIQGLRELALPTSREQAVAELARLEHERAQLTRELNLWTEKQQKTGQKVHQVELRLARLKAIIDPPTEQAPATAAAGRPTRGEGVEPTEHKERHRTVELRY